MNVHLASVIRIRSRHSQSVSYVLTAAALMPSRIWL